MTSALSVGQDVGDHLGDPHLGGDGAGRRGVVAGQEHWPQPERRELGDGRGTGRLGGVRDDDEAARPAVPADRDDRLALRLRGSRARPRARPAGSGPTRRAGSAGRRPRAWPSTTPSTPRPSRLRNDSTGGSAPPSLRAALGDRAGDRVLRGVLERADEAQQLGAVAVAGRDDDVAQLHAPGRDGAGLVEHDRVDAPRRLQHLGALDQDAELGAAARADEQRRRRRESERARAGDDQHGDGGRDREGRARAAAEPEAERGDGEGDHDGHEDRRDAVGQSLHGRLARLRLGHEPADLGERGVGADLGRAHDETPADVDGRADDLVAGVLLDRDGLARQERLIDGRGALLDDAVGRDLLARAARRSGRRPEARRSGRAARDRRRRAPRRPWRRARAAPAARRRSGAWRAPRSSARPG